MNPSELDNEVTKAWFGTTLWCMDHERTFRAEDGCFIGGNDCQRVTLVVPVSRNWQAHLALEEKVRAAGLFIYYHWDRDASIGEHRVVLAYIEEHSRQHDATGSTYLEAYAKAALKINPPAGRR